MSIIKLKTPWCFHPGDLSKHEYDRFCKYFDCDGDDGNGWDSDRDWYCGFRWDGLSDYYDSIKSFDEDDNEENVTVYTIKQLRDIIAEHLAKQPVEKLEDGVVYYATDPSDKYEWILVNNVSYIDLIQSRYETHGTNFDENKTFVYTKATPEQIAHYEACVKAGKYVEPKSVTQFVVGKWYKWFQKDHGRTQKGKCATLYDSHVEMKPWICHSSEYVESGMFNLRDVESIEVIKDLSEIQDLLPDGHKDKWVKTAPKSERYLETMKFFEQLREPERSEAIANYDEDYGSGTKVPKDLAEAINYGFEWSSTKQEHEYWMVIKDEIMSGIYFQEEILVFGKYKIGDIVVLQVCTDRYPMFKVSKDSTPDKMVDETGAHSTNPGSFRPATSEEVEAYNQGVRNVADIKPKDYKEAVHCTTQEEWDFVLSKNKFKGTCSSSWTQHKKDTYMDLHHGSFGDVNGTGKDWGYTILTFKQWCEKYGHSYEVVIEYVECVNSTSHHYKEGKIYTWPKTITEEGKFNEPGILNGCVWEFKPSTKEAYDKQQEKLKMEELLSEAKRRYPAGTYVLSAYKGTKCKVASHEKLFVDFAGRVDNNGYGFLYCEGKWAEIVKEEPKPTEIKPTKGMHVRCLKENNWSDGKTKVGQVFEIESVDWIGDMWVNNHSFSKERLERGEFELLPNYKEEPWIAQVGDWVYVLENCAYGGVLNKGEIVKCIKYDTISQQFKEEGCTWLRPKDYRKATQEEIDSVTKSTVTNTQTEWTADNWYVEVSSQEEADAMIDAAAKMYGEPYDKYFAFNDEWKYVGLCHKNKDYTLLSRKFIHVGAKPRPITDFIQPEKPTLLETVKKTFFDKPTQQATPDDSYIFAGEVTEEEFNEIKRLCKPQQDELVIYKPKQTRLVEPGAVSASASTTNLIIKSNSKYL